ncbi:potassium channel family protein [Tautonia plasticadhaerens]|uniref:Inner membrane protein YbaL n=1 Tax=Tautonia plasticadhaerens TaxID=2527974 RepID=A0A518GYW0_9BACT|nr:potassium channel protein [Tautonia plasticadhaerens]QDV33796.1 Inner membrane protein YbaL [Tautonia plasticadhaerens]
MRIRGVWGSVRASWERTLFRRLLLGAGGLGLVVVWGTIGYVWMGWTWSDALYMVVITISTVGFTEVRPLTTPSVRLHTMIVIGLGTVTVAYVIGAFLSLFTEGELKRILGNQNLRRRLLNLQDHVIIVGFGRMGSLIADELASTGRPFVVIERDPALIAEIERKEIPYVVGDASEEEVLIEAGLARAHALVTAVSTDADSVFITLTARQLAPGLTVIARAAMPSSERKLRQAGANHVILTAAIGARRIASLLHNPNTVEFVELVTRQSELDLEIQEVPVRAGDGLDGRSLRDADIGRRTGVMVIAIKRASGPVEFPPPGDESLRPGDGVILLGRREQLHQFRAAFCPAMTGDSGED